MTIAGTVAICSCALMALLLGASPSAHAGDPGGGDALLPDLIVERPGTIILKTRPKRPFASLRFSHTTSNKGAGPLEIYPDLNTTSCGDEGADGRVTYQRTYDAGGGIAEDLEVGCMIFHLEHDHYHFEDFALYRIYRERTGKLKATSDKISFCVFDGGHRYPGLPGSPAEREYNFTNCKEENGTHGISVGWEDTYRSDTQGQRLNVTGMKRGRFCLVASTDPAGRLTENAPAGELNNDTEIRIKLNPRRRAKADTLVSPLDGPCKYSTR